MILEIVLIIVVFGSILTVALYKYLLQSPEYKEKTLQSQTVNGVNEKFVEDLAERVYRLFENVETLEKKFSDFETYFQQKVEIWKKKGKT